MAEYAGLVVLAALVLGALVPVVVAPVRDYLDYTICKIFAGGDAAQCESPADKKFKPSSCMLGLSTNTYGGQVDIAFFQIGKDLTFMRTTTVDNNGNKTVTVTAVDGQSVGVGTGIGVGVHGGGVNLGADAEVNANLKIGIGDAWQFTGPDAEKQADNMIGDIREQATIDSVKHTGPLGWLAGEAYDAVAGPDIRDSDIDRYEVSVNAGGSVSAGLGLGPGNPKGKHAKNRQDPNAKDKRGDNGITPNASAGVAVDGTEKAVVEHNKKTGDTSTTLILSGGANANENHIWDGNRWVRNYGGMVKVTKNKDGQITALDLTRNTADGGKATWTTTHLPLTNDQDRQAVSDYLLSDAATKEGQTALNLTWDDLAPTDPPGPDANPLEKLLYEKGQTTRQNYTYDSSQKDYGATVKLGLKLGANLSIGSTDQKLTDAQYLGAPGADGKREYKNYKECHA